MVEILGLGGFGRSAKGSRDLTQAVGQISVFMLSKLQRAISRSNVKIFRPVIGDGLFDLLSL